MDRNGEARTIWTLVISGWSASDERVFGDQNPLIPHRAYLQSEASHVLGRPISVSTPRTESLRSGSPATDSDGFLAPPRCYTVSADGAVGSEVFAALVEVVERMPLAMTPGPLNLEMLLRDGDGQVIAEQAVVVNAVA